MARLTCFAEFDHPRLRYALRLLVERHLGWDYDLVLDPTTYAGSPGPCLNYSRQRRRPDEVFIPAGRLLRGEDPGDPTLSVVRNGGLPYFFAREVEGADVPCDVLALVFYLVSRYEEYRPFAPDAHGRFPARASLAWREGFLDRPLADEWCERLADELFRAFPRSAPARRAFDVLTTYDIDHAWAFRHRTAWNLAGSLGKAAWRGRWPEVGERWRVWVQGERDPFDTFAYLEDLNRQWDLPAMYFFLLPERRQGPDRAVDHRRKALRALIREISARHPVGIHPSYYALEKPERIGREVEHLRSITGKEVEHSRQHFLRFRLPRSYRDLLNHGLRHDHTMGYADAIGFRASTARPFPWYDLERERETPLTVHPFQVMDGTLKKYMKLRPGEAFDRLLPLIRRTRAVGGRFVSLWHNSSFGPLHGWSPWKPVYERLLATLGEHRT